ncbi:uncharacterized protein LOC111714872 [Eurytemora carolleeae]|uniref:uncharacterized protein LOC111714872 n=1 Tax=Eurytemora carolleeae TaxID=1294199 RepID=UPI000C77B3D8|nr:uncharacterized protein LOC111714872 [Eurytemora carolleeae]|eukprot:XP_023345854.1 uncharacterized protein LOC111714872 [Eurytemora affinis]
MGLQNGWSPLLQYSVDRLLLHLPSHLPSPNHLYPTDLLLLLLLPIPNLLLGYPKSKPLTINPSQLNRLISKPDFNPSVPAPSSTISLLQAKLKNNIPIPPPIPSFDQPKPAFSYHFGEPINLRKKSINKPNQSNPIIEPPNISIEPINHETNPTKPYKPPILPGEPETIPTKPYKHPNLTGDAETNPERKFNPRVEEPSRPSPHPAPHPPPPRTCDRKVEPGQFYRNIDPALLRLSQPPKQGRKVNLQKKDSIYAKLALRKPKNLSFSIPTGKLSRFERDSAIIQQNKVTSFSSKQIPNINNNNMNNNNNSNCKNNNMYSSQNNSSNNINGAGTGFCTMKVYAKCLAPDIEYKTVNVPEIISSRELVLLLLSKYRMKNRDPKLFYLTMDVTIRKTGIPIKRTMVLEDIARPAQLKSCNPWGDCRFSLQMRKGGLVRIHDSVLMEESKYKCLLISDETTVEDVIRILLNCYGLENLEDVTRFCLFEVKEKKELKLSRSEKLLSVQSNWSSSSSSSSSALHRFVLKRSTRSVSNQFPEESCVDELSSFPTYNSSSSSSSSICSEIEAAFLPSSSSYASSLALPSLISISRPHENTPSSLPPSVLSESLPYPEKKVKVVKGPSIRYVKDASQCSLSSQSNISEPEQYFYI